MSNSYRNNRSLFLILKLFLMQTFILGYCEGVEFCLPQLQQLTYTQMGSSIYNITSPGYPASTYNTTVLPLLPMKPKIGNSPFAVKRLSETLSGYISSHEMFDNFYENSINNYLALEDIPREATGIVIEFIYFNLGNQATTSCSAQNDIIRIYTLVNSYQQQPFFCGDTTSLPPTLVWNFTDSPRTTSLLFEFETNSGGAFRGFLLKYSMKPSSLTLPTSESASKTTESGSQSSVTSTTLSTPISQSDDSTCLEKFFQKDMNIIAVAAGGGGLILIIIIIILCCVICKRNQTSKLRSEEAFPAGGKEGSDVDSRIIQISLTPAIRRSEAGRREQGAGRRYTSVDMELPDPYSSVDEDKTNPHTFVLRENNNGNTSKKPKASIERREPDGKEAPGAEIYAEINQKTKKKKVEMKENDLYASRDSLNSDQSSD